MVNIMTIRNFHSLHSLKQRLGIMESHVKTTADGHYTASIYSSLSFYLYVLTVNLLRAFVFPM